MRSIKRPQGLLTPYFPPVLHLPLTPCFFYTGWACQPTRGSAAASRVVEPTRGRAAANRAVRNTRGTEQYRAQPGPAAANRVVRPIRGPVAAIRAMRPTRGTGSGQPGGAAHPGTGSDQRAVRPIRGTERCSPTGDQQRPAGGAA